MIDYRLLQEKLEQPVTGPPSPRDIHNGDTAQNLSAHIENLRGEVTNLKHMLRTGQMERKCSKRMSQCRFMHIMLSYDSTFNPLGSITISQAFNT